MTNQSRAEARPIEKMDRRKTAPVRAEVLRDNRLSLAARGLYAVLAATPQEEAAEQLSLLSGTEFWGDIPKLLKELATLGYISGEGE